MHKALEKLGLGLEYDEKNGIAEISPTKSKGSSPKKKKKRITRGKRTTPMPGHQ